MGDTKDSALTAATSVALTDGFAIVQSSASKYATFNILKQGLGAGYRNASTATVSAAYAADTYLAGSAVTVPAGAWAVGTIYDCTFDMTKTAAGTAAFTVSVRIGTLGTTGDPALFAHAFAVGTAAIDSGIFRCQCVFRTVGSGSSAVVSSWIMGTHHLAATGLISTGASGTGIVFGVSAGFASNTPTVLGLSVNGGASFSGTNTVTQAQVVL